MITSTRQTALLSGEQMTVTQLMQHYTEHELPRLAYSTKAAYVSYLKSWIGPTSPLTYEKSKLCRSKAGWHR